jgi:hypothetical protein
MSLAQRYAEDRLWKNYRLQLISTCAFVTQARGDRSGASVVLDLLCNDAYEQDVASVASPGFLGPHTLSLQQAFDLMVFVALDQLPNADGRQRGKPAATPSDTVVALKIISKTLCDCDTTDGEALRRAMASCGFDFGPDLGRATQRMTAVCRTSLSDVDRVLHNVQQLAAATGRDVELCRTEVYRQVAGLPAGGATRLSHRELASLLQHTVSPSEVRAYVARACCTSRDSAVKVLRTAGGGSSVVRLSDPAEEQTRAGILGNQQRAAAFFCNVLTKLQRRDSGMTPGDILRIYS